jgi:sugar-specific transcriptional regulator TrmB
MLYYVLNQLTRRGLVRASKDKTKTVYIAEDPKRLYDLLIDKENSFTSHTARIRSLIPELRRHYRLSSVRPVVRTLDGIDAYLNALNEILASKPSVILAYEPQANNKSAEAIRRSFDRQRQAKKIPKKVLVQNSTAAVKSIAKRQYNDYTEYRSHPHLDTVVDLMLIDGALLYTTLYDNHEPSAVLIEDKALWTHQRVQFESQWKQAKDLTLTQKTV